MYEASTELDQWRNQWKRVQLCPNGFGFGQTLKPSMCCATCQKATFDFAVPAASTWKEIRRCGVRPASRVPLFTSRSNHFDSSPHRCTWPQSRHRFLMSQTSQGVVNVCVKLNQIYLLIYLGFAFSIILTSSLYVAAISPSTLNIAQVTCTGPADERPPPRRRCAGTSFRTWMKGYKGVE